MHFCRYVDLRGVFVFSLLVFSGLLIFSAAGSADNKDYRFIKETKSALTAKLNIKEDCMTSKDRLSEEEGNYLLATARNAIEKVLLGKEVKEEYNEAGASAKLVQRRGTFVTLTKGGNLRGCIGHIIPQEPLLDGVRINAINAAFKDPRFRPLSKEELKKVKLEVSILTEPRQVSYSSYRDLLEKLRPGMDGVIIKKGVHQATFLPQVWEQLPEKEEFLTHLCLKAGLEGGAWKKEELEVSTYQVQAFYE